MHNLPFYKKRPSDWSSLCLHILLRAEYPGSSRGERREESSMDRIESIRKRVESRVLDSCIAVKT